MIPADDFEAAYLEAACWPKLPPAPLPNRAPSADAIEGPVLEALRACARHEFAAWTEDRHDALMDWIHRHPQALAWAAAQFLDECRK